MPAPRDLADLAFAPHLHPVELRPVPEASYDSVLVDGASVEDVEAGGVRFLESALRSVEFTGGSQRRSRWSEVWLHGVRWVGTSLAQASWLDLELISGALVGVEFHGAELRRVAFFGCKLDSVNLRGATLAEVSFVDCTLREVDLGEATLDRLTVPGSAVERLRLGGARCKAVDLRGARSLDLVGGIETLRGVTITQAQLLELAPGLAREAGVDVRPR